jgi:rRNA maturation endonuclease Nob1
MILAVAILVALAALYYTLFVRDKDIPEPIPISPIQHLQDRKQAIYENLRDLQFEYRLGKLSDGDYQQTKLALQKELALVLAETEETTKRLGLTPIGVPAKQTPSKPKAVVQKSPATLCPHCGASFSQHLKFCGECGKAIAS